MGPVASDGRIGRVGAVVSPSPWLLEMREAVLVGTAKVLSRVDRCLPGDTAAALEGLLYDAEPGVPPKPISSAARSAKSGGGSQGQGVTNLYSAALADLGGLLATPLLDLAVTRALLREATHDHKPLPPQTASGGGTATAAAAGGDDDSSSAELNASGFPFAVPDTPRAHAPPLPSSSKEGATSAGSSAQAAGDGTTKDSGVAGADAAAANSAASLEESSANAMRWRYVVVEACRSLLLDDLLVMRQWSTRRLQRLLAPHFPLTSFSEEECGGALDARGGDVLMACHLLKADGAVRSESWGDSKSALSTLLEVITGGGGVGSGGEGGAGELVGVGGSGSFDHGGNDNAAHAMFNARDSSDDLESLAELGEMVPTSHPAERHHKSSRNATTASSITVAAKWLPWELADLLPAADAGSRGGGPAPVRKLLPALHARARWLSEMTGLPIQEKEVALCVCQAAAGLRNQCVVSPPSWVAAANRATAQEAAAATALTQPSFGEGGSSARAHDGGGPAAGGGLAASSSSKEQNPSTVACVDVSSSVAFERLYALPQVLAATSVATRGAIAFQRKLDLARVGHDTHSAKAQQQQQGGALALTAAQSLGRSPSTSGAGGAANGKGKALRIGGGSGGKSSPPGSASPMGAAANSGKGKGGNSVRESAVNGGAGGGNSGAAAAAAGLQMANLAERFECTVDRLGWWCVGAPSFAPCTLRGRLVFDTASADFLLGMHGGAAGGAVGGGRRGSTTDSMSSANSSVVSVSSAGFSSNAGGGGGEAGDDVSLSSSMTPAQRESSTAVFFASSRKFFDPSLPGPSPPSEQSLQARASTLLGNLTVVTTATAAAGVACAGTAVGAGSSVRSGTADWCSPPASCGVLKPGLDEIVIFFVAGCVAGQEVYLEARVDRGCPSGGAQGSGGTALRFGPFTVPSHGGAVNAGELTFRVPTSY